MEQTSITYNEAGALLTPCIQAVRRRVESAIRAAMARAEISEAINRVKGRSVEYSSAPARMRVVSPLPRYRYVHTCPRCRSHAISHAFLSGGLVLRLCAGCRWVYDLEEQLL